MEAICTPGVNNFSASINKKGFRGGKNKNRNKKIKVTSTPNANTLEEQISQVADKFQVPVKMLESTPAAGNCWYEATAATMKQAGMESIPPSKLRQLVVDYFPQSMNFKHILKVCFDGNIEEVEKFQKLH